MYKNISVILESLKQVNESSLLPGKCLSGISDDLKKYLKRWYLIDFQNSKFNKISNARDLKFVNDFEQGFILIFDNDVLMYFIRVEKSPRNLFFDMYTVQEPIKLLKKVSQGDLDQLIKQGSDAYYFSSKLEDNQNISMDVAKKRRQRYIDKGDYSVQSDGLNKVLQSISKKYKFNVSKFNFDYFDDDFVCNATFEGNGLLLSIEFKNKEATIKALEFYDALIDRDDLGGLSKELKNLSDLLKSLDEDTRSTVGRISAFL